MSDTGKQILNLMSQSGKSASEMTHAVKILGDGDMQRGFARIGEYFSTEIVNATSEGLMRGRVQGGIAGVTLMAIAGGVAWWFTRDRKAAAEHEAEGDKILHAMESPYMQEADIEQMDLHGEATTSADDIERTVPDE